MAGCMCFTAREKKTIVTTENVFFSGSPLSVCYFFAFSCCCCCNYLYHKWVKMAKLTHTSSSKRWQLTLWLHSTFSGFCSLSDSRRISRFPDLDHFHIVQKWKMLMNWISLIHHTSLRWMSPYVCAHMCPAEACGRQLSLIIATFPPICWRVLTCGYTKPTKAYNMSPWLHSHTYIHRDTLGPLREGVTAEFHTVNILCMCHFRPLALPSLLLLDV